MADLLQDVILNFKAYIDGGKISARTLVELEPGDVLMLDHDADKPLKGSLNGEAKWEGYIATLKDHLVFEVSDICEQAKLGIHSKDIYSLSV